MFHHLRASRALVLMELQRPSNERENTLRGFVLELYAYLALVGNITITSEVGQRSIELDPFLFSLESLAKYPTFGFMFGCAYELFGMIPRICQLGRRRMMEDRRSESSLELFSQYQTLQQKIQDWEPPTPTYLDTGPEKTNMLIIAARIYQKGLLIFLHSSFYISNAKDPILAAEVESIADEMFLLLEAISTRAASTILWPMIIMGSCLRLPEKRHKLSTLR